MQPLQMVLVILVALVAGMSSVLDERQFHRPLVACTLMGLVLGDLPTGIALGGSLELIALGWMNVGAAMAPDAALASTLASVVVITNHQSIATGIAIAVPIAAAGQVLTIFVRTIAVFFQHQADKFAEQANFRGIEAMHFSALGLQGLRVAIPTAAVAAVSGTDVVEKALAAIPHVVTGGLQVAGGFIVVVGYAMVINMMKARSLMPFFFLGFVIAAFSGYNLVGLGIMGAAFAVIYVQLNPLYHDAIKLPANAPAVATAGAGSAADDDLDDELN
ncbi:MAG: PTS mannose/fructose/sorbose transporter subunit IIC [Propionibacterium sp.]